MNLASDRTAPDRGAAPGAAGGARPRDANGARRDGDPADEVMGRFVDLADDLRDLARVRVEFLREDVRDAVNQGRRKIWFATIAIVGSGVAVFLLLRGISTGLAARVGPAAADVLTGGLFLGATVLTHLVRHAFRQRRRRRVLMARVGPRPPRVPERRP